EEWSKRSDNWIAKACNVSDHLVAAVRADSTSNSRSCLPETNDQRESEDGKKPARNKRATRPKAFPTEVDEREEGELVEDEEFTVPGKLSEQFGQAPGFRSLAAEMTKVAAKLQEIEASKAYRDATQNQKKRKLYSTDLLTAATTLRDFAPAVVCIACRGD